MQAIRWTGGGKGAFRFGVVEVEFREATVEEEVEWFSVNFAADFVKAKVA